MKDDPVLFVVATPIGNLSDLTERAERVLKRVPLVLAEDTERTKKLLSHIDSGARLESLHEHSRPSKLERVLEDVTGGDEAAIVSDAGNPAVSDPAHRLVDRCLETDVRVVPVPGPSAVTAALSVSGFRADRFRFEGYPPEDEADRNRWLAGVLSSPAPVVLFLPPRLVQTVGEELGKQAPDRTLTVAREMTKTHEEIRRVTGRQLAEEVVDREVKGEWTLVVSPRPDTEPAEEAPEEASEVPAEQISFLLEEMDLSPSKSARILARLLDRDRGDVYDRILRWQASQDE